MGNSYYDYFPFLYYEQVIKNIIIFLESVPPIQWVENGGANIESSEIFARKISKKAPIYAVSDHLPIR